MSKAAAILTLAMVFAALTTGRSDGLSLGHGLDNVLGHVLGNRNSRGPGNRNGHGPGNNGVGKGERNVGLEVGFYEGKCKSFDVEAIVGDVVREWFQTDPTIAAALLRMQFHDCFVKGCDASILLDGADSEKTAGPNGSVRGFNLIDAIKAKLEDLCSTVVSCADIIVMATRDAVALSKGGKYNVETGRKDGTESLKKNVNLPPPTISVSDSIRAFNAKNLSTTDMIYLLGGHTVGIAHCSLFQDRLYNFKNTNGADPNMDKDLLNALKFKCPQNAKIDNKVELDQNPMNITNTVDNSYYRQIVMRRGILQIDQDLALDPLSKSTVEFIAKGFDFSTRFGEAMVKLGRVDVLTGKQGEIRHKCNVVNKP